MNPKPCLIALVAFAALAATPAVARSAEPAFLGRWLITEARAAPWVDPKDPTTQPFDDHLVGRSVIYSRLRINAPRPLACERPHYEWHDYPPESLFQGSLTSPATQAAALGFPPGAIRTLETGCAGAIDFHFTRAGTALFALNNLIYTLRKQ